MPEEKSVCVGVEEVAQKRSAFLQFLEQLQWNNPQMQLPTLDLSVL